MHSETIEYLPLVPRQILRAHKVYEPFDTRFRAAARLLQALWREDEKLLIGSYSNKQGRSRKLGSRLTAKAGESGRNFLSPDTARMVHREIAYREIGAFIDEDRLRTNLLSSMPLAFNLFAPLKRNLTLATRVMGHLLPDFAGEITQIVFEHAPGRGNPTYTGDHTAFDVLLRYRTPVGRTGCIAIEIKYSESMQEPVPVFHGRYLALIPDSGLYHDPTESALRTNPLQQLCREHLLAQTMVERGLYDEAMFLVIAPRLNYHAQQAAGAYRDKLADPTGKVPFQAATLETVIDTLAAVGDPALATALHARYAAFERIDALI
jgi:hypothetical protein